MGIRIFKRIKQNQKELSGCKGIYGDLRGFKWIQYYFRGSKSIFEILKGIQGFGGDLM